MGPALALAGSLLTASCTVGPDYTSPAVDMPAAFGGITGTGSGGAATPVDAAVQNAWWAGLQAPVLTDLVTRAADRNLTVAAARARVREARALRRAAGAAFDPRLDAAAGVRTGRTSKTVDSNDTGGNSDFHSVGFDAAWEIDLFGGGWRTAEAATARYEVAIEEARGVLITVMAEVARNYVELCAAQRRMVLAESTIAMRQRLAERVRNRYRAGLAVEYDVAGSEAQLERSRAQVPKLRAQIRAAAHRIAVLTGDNPSNLVERLTAEQPPPAAPDLVPVGLPSDLLQRRPDLRRAERAVHAATAEVGVATADLFPRVSLTGSVGLRSGSFTDLFQAASGAWSFGPSITIPLFNQGRLQALVDAAGARAEASVAEYRQAVLIALEEVENELVRHAQEQIRSRDLRQAVARSRRALELATDLYDRGLKDIVNVLSAQREANEAEEALIASETAAMLHLVALYKALGGGWAPSDLMG
ncbi:efflux transporter outer membrane subunit [Azospirillum sp. RWY-5-1]|uniref:Efflux transporter outer membrane subunit n=1 Tax=Azospirillum oleiclasticum TaxID=2735135 RepID=A0ABX2TM45_9PROT|nr:efflux transporter outer membrane subunit [Azospirillum oleiclasticum]NYZ14511.1 efflux transporter outer membrane subunit [Azospirillum oleiclasticum]NYZ24289.1 efflux transporter outer membrane subunit [Azospirillum oleiclasticum]